MSEVFLYQIFYISGFLFTKSEYKPFMCIAIGLCVITTIIAAFYRVTKWDYVGRYSAGTIGMAKWYPMIHRDYMLAVCQSSTCRTLIIEIFDTAQPIGFAESVWFTAFTCQTLLCMNSIYLRISLQSFLYMHCILSVPISIVGVVANTVFCSPIALSIQNLLVIFSTHLFVADFIALLTLRLKSRCTITSFGEIFSSCRVIPIASITGLNITILSRFRKIVAALTGIKATFTHITQCANGFITPEEIFFRVRIFVAAFSTSFKGGIHALIIPQKENMP